MAPAPEPDRRPEDWLVNEQPRSSAKVGPPILEHNQWTFEGEIERLGAFSSGASRSQGWKRAVGIVLVIAMLSPIVLAFVVWTAQLL